MIMYIDGQLREVSLAACNSKVGVVVVEEKSTGRMLMASMEDYNNAMKGLNCSTNSRDLNLLKK